MTDEGGIASGGLALTPTKLGVNREGRECQVVLATLPGDPDLRACSVELEADGSTQSFTAQSLSRGPNQLLVPVPMMGEPRQITVRVRGDVEDEAQLVVPPFKKKRIHLLHHSHQDPGYVDLPSRMRASFLPFLDEALDICDLTDPYPEESQFRWNVEDAYLLDDYLAVASEENKERLFRRMREGRITVSGMYCDVHLDTCGLEELVQIAALARRAIDRSGTRTRYAWLSDVPGMPYVLPQVLNGFGVTSLVWCGNSFRSRGYADGLPSLFRWQGVDGSELLVSHVHYFGQGFARLYDLTLGTANLEFPRLMRALDRVYEEYDTETYEDSMISVAADFNHPQIIVSRMAQLWNAQWSSPQMVVSTPQRYFGAIEQTVGDRVPTLKGAVPDSWVDGFAAAAAASARSRNSHLTLPALRTAATLLPGSDDEKADVERTTMEAFRSMIWFDEHTFGWARDNDPYNYGREYWLEKTAPLDEVEAASEKLGERIEASAGASDGGPQGLVLINPHSWDGEFVVETGADLADGLRPDAPIDEDGDGTVRFLAHLPANGVSYMPLAGHDGNRSENGSRRKASASEELATDHLRVTVPGGSSGIAIEDVRSGRSWAGGGQYGFGSYIQLRGERHSLFSVEEKGRTVVDEWELGERWGSALAEHLTLHHRSDALGPIDVTLTLWRHQPRLDYHAVIDKPRNYDPEACYFAFPFEVASPVFKIGQAGGWFEPGSEQLPGSCYDHYAVQDWASIDDPDADRHVLLVCRDAPIISIGDPQPSTWRKSVTPGAALFSMVFNNHWPVNFPVCQEGRVEMRYSLLFVDGPFEPVAAARFGREAMRPPLVFPGGEGAPDALAVRLEPDNVRVETIGSAPGTGLVVRMSEIAGSGAEARLAVGAPVSRAVETALDGTPERELPVSDAAVEVAFEPFEIKTVQLEL